MAIAEAGGIESLIAALRNAEAPAAGVCVCVYVCMRCMYHLSSLPYATPKPPPPVWSSECVCVFV